MEKSREMSKILIFGGTGYTGKYMVKASVMSGHKTFVYTRPLTPRSTPAKLEVHKEFAALGVTIVHGELDEHEKLVSVIKQVDVVISALAHPQCFEQLKVIEAIKVAGNVKRFLPSEFGCEVDRTSPQLPPFEICLEKKRNIRRAIEAAQIPYTYVCSNAYGAYFVNFLLKPYQQQEEIIVYGTGQAKAVLNYEEDIATYTIKVANDPRTCNKAVIYRPEKNIISQLELISLWELKTGLSFKRVHVPEDEIIKLSETLPHPDNIPISILHSLFVKGELMSFEIDDKEDTEASKLYPDNKFITVDQLLDIFLVDPPKPVSAAFA